MLKSKLYGCSLVAAWAALAGGAWAQQTADAASLLPAQWAFSVTSLVRDEQGVSAKTQVHSVCLRPGAKPATLPLFPALTGAMRCLIGQFSVRQPRFELMINCDEGDYGSSIVLYLQRRAGEADYVGQLDHNQHQRYGWSANAWVTAKPVGPCAGAP